MNISQIFFKIATDEKIGFAIATLIGYCLYKIMLIINKRKLQSSSNETLNMVINVKIYLCLI